VADRIINTKLVYFFGLGGSGKVGTIGEVWFSHIGCISRAVIDPYEMIVTAGHAHGDCNIITLSHSGSTQPVIEATKKAKSNGAFVACVTNYSESPLAGLADILLLTACPERRVHFAQSNSMVAQSTIVRSLYILVASRSKEPVIKRVGKIERDVKARLRMN
jgi:DNA-binding MurR/RpiR family transcriptional regulator